VLSGFAVYAVLAALGVTALLAAVPFAYDALRIIGAGYLGWMAWNAFRTEASLFHARQLPIDSPARLYGMGLLTNLLNPKIAVLYLSLFPQFVDPTRGHVFAQSIILGSTQIAISATVNSVIVMMAGSIATFLGSRPLWSRAQRWFMGTVLGLLAVRMAADSGK
jgi:threonine/homoserine/homoserine lactone efflux protein